MVAVYEISGPRRICSRSNDRVETMLLHHCVDPLCSRLQVILCERVTILLFRQRTLLLRHDHYFLAEIRHLAIAIPLVKVNDVFERSHFHRCRKACEILVQVCLELVEENFKLTVVESSRSRNVGGIDDNCTLFFHYVERSGNELVGCVVEPGEFLSRDTDSRSSQSFRVERASVINSRLTFARESSAVGGIDAGENRQQERRVSDGARHRPGGVLAVRNRNDSRSAQQAERWLDAHEAVDRSRPYY